MKHELTVNVRLGNVKKSCQYEMKTLK